MTMTTPQRLLAFLAILGHIVQEGLLQVFHVLREHGITIFLQVPRAIFALPGIFAAVAMDSE
jgi:hypothetical protein